MAERQGQRTREGSLDRRTWLVIVLLALVGQIAWAVENNFFNLFVQDAFGASLADVAPMVSASAITATATTLLVGTWSDRVGRRKPFVVLGTLVWGLTICAFAVLQQVSGVLAHDAAAAATLGITLSIAFDCLMTFFGSLANDACFNAWLTDITDDTNRGRVEGVNSAMPLLSMLAVFGGAMLLMVVGPDGSVTYDYPLFFAIIGCVVIATGVAAAALMRESAPESRRDKGYLDELAWGFRPSSVRDNRMLYLVLLGYCTFACAMQVFMPYYVIYLRLPYVLGESYVLVMAPCIVIASVFTILYGRRVDALGFSRTITLPLVLFVVGCALLTATTAAPVVFVGSMLMLSGYLGSVACFSAAIRNATPAGHVGLYQGIRIFMVVLVPMLVGPWIGSAVSASSGVVGLGVVGDDFTPSSLVFAAGAAVSLLTFVVTWLIRREERRR